MIELTQEDIEDIRKEPNGQNWYNLSINYQLPENFIREFHNKVIWFYISIYQKLSEDFIREFQYIVDWRRISIYQILSENLIREFKEYVHWTYISCHQKFSEEFFVEFKEKLLNKDYFENCCYSKNYNNIKHYLKHGMKFNNKSRKHLISWQR